MSKCLCFLIDDDPDDREIFNIALNDVDPDFECVTANNAVEALNTFEEQQDFVPDYIFLDLNMPLLSGQQCLAEMRKKAHLKNVPIIIYSTSSNEKDFESTKQLGANHFLVKPSSISVLVSKLNEVFNKKNLPFLLNEE